MGRIERLFLVFATSMATMTRQMQDPMIAEEMQQPNAPAWPMIAEEMRQPNPPAWPSTVTVFGPEDADVSERMALLSATLNDRSKGHFSSERRAFLFKPGRYEDVEAAVGYYTQVAGLGFSPDDVVVGGGGGGARGVFVDAMDKRPGGAGSLDTFWRAMENLRHEGPELRWAVCRRRRSAASG